MSVSLVQAVEADDIVIGLRKYLTQGDIATGVGVSERAVRDWGNHRVEVRPRNYVSLAHVRDVVVTLSDSLTSRGVRQWLLAPNRILDRRTPLQVLHDGHPEQVLDAANAFVQGVYL